MAERKNFNTTKVPKMSEFFPQSVIVGDYIFLSGTPGYFKLKKINFFGA